MPRKSARMALVILMLGNPLFFTVYLQYVLKLHILKACNEINSDNDIVEAIKCNQNTMRCDVVKSVKLLKQLGNGYPVQLVRPTPALVCLVLLLECVVAL